MFEIFHVSLSGAEQVATVCTQLPNFMAVYPIVGEKFKSGPTWWTSKKYEVKFDLRAVLLFSTLNSHHHFVSTNILFL